MQNKSAGGIRYRSLRSTAVRPHNRRLVLQLLRERGDLTRPEIAAASGLSAAAISSVVSELIADGLITDSTAPSPMPAGDARRPVGRPASTISLAADSRVVLAVQIGAGIVQAGVAGLDASLLAHTSFPVRAERSATRTLNEVAGALDALLADTCRDRADVLGIGVGAAGLVDRDGRVNVVSANTGWRDVAMADRLETELGIATTVDHNVRAMATGEARYGHGVDVESLLYVYARTGLGVGLILDGRPYRGGRIDSHEIAHIAVPGGLDCVCGKTGCVETVVSDRALAHQLYAAGVTASDEFDAETVAAFAAAVSAGDRQAVAARDRFVAALAAALAPTIEFLDPHLVVLGGLLDDCGDVIGDALRRELTARLTPWMREGPPIVRTAFGGASGLVGAATVALDTFLFGLMPLRESNVDARIAAAREHAVTEGAPR